MSEVLQQEPLPESSEDPPDVSSHPPMDGFTIITSPPSATPVPASIPPTYVPVSAPLL